MTADHIPHRAARDRMVDFLLRGQTAPLADLDIPTEKLTVPFETTAEISIINSQQGVMYQLVYPDGTAPASMRAEGNGQTLTIKTDPIQEDVKLMIRATKLPVYVGHFKTENGRAPGKEKLIGFLTALLPADRALPLADELAVIDKSEVDDPLVPEKHRVVNHTAGGGTMVVVKKGSGQAAEFRVYLGNQRQVDLEETATVKVGLNRFLPVWIDNEPFLDPTRPHTPTDRWPRLVAYGRVVTVKVANSQEEVKYKLVQRVGENEVDLSPEAVTGNLDTIEIQSNPVTEDVDILVRATKSFAEIDGRPDETTLLEVVLPVRVRANPALGLQAQPAPIIDYGGQPMVQIDGSQSSAAYQLFGYEVADSDFRRINPDNDPVVTVPVPGEPAVHIATEPHVLVWQTPAGYRPLSAWHPGNGAALDIQGEKLVHETLVIVQARKEHRAGRLTVTQSDDGSFVVEPLSPVDLPDVASDIRLQATVAILVRPNPEPGLRAEAQVVDGDRIKQIRLFDGQLGVFYDLYKERRISVTPAYFHQRSAADPEENKGIGLFEIEVDFVPVDAVIETEPGSNRFYPAPPLIDVRGVSLGDVLTVRGQKGQTRVIQQLTKQLIIHPIPPIRVDPAVVPLDGTARILIDASPVGERYELWLDGQQIGNGRIGNGEQRLFTINNVTADATYELRISRPQEAQIPLIRIKPVSLIVAPSDRLPVLAGAEEIRAGDATTIEIDGTERHVGYRLLIGDERHGKAAPGNGGTIALPTPKLQETTTFGVLATRLDRADVSVTLTQRVTITVVAPEPEDA